MKLFDILVESRMREWQNRSDSDKERRREGHDERVSYETQVVNEIERLVRQSRELEPEKAQQLLREANDRTTELLMMLEHRGYVLTAKLVGEKIASLRQGSGE